MRRRLALTVLLAVAAGACTPRFNWREVRSADGGYAVLFPGKPQIATRDVEFMGNKIAMTMTSTGTGPTMFAVGVVVLPDGALRTPQRAQTLEWFADGLARNLGAPRATVEPISTPARLAAAGTDTAAFDIASRGKLRDRGVDRDGREARLAARFYVVDDRLFQLIAIGAEGEIPPQALETFFDSFRLLSQKGAP